MLTDKYLADVYDQFLHVAVEGHPRRSGMPIVGASELSNFSKIVSTINTTSSGSLELSDILNILTGFHPIYAPLISVSAPQLSSLIRYHARFPFSSPVKLTGDALLRSTMLLTDSGHQFFKDEEKLRGEDDDIILIRARSAKDRMASIFEALAETHTKASPDTHEAILDVLSRLQFPAPIPPSMIYARPRKDFQKMAERLEPQNGREYKKGPDFITGQEITPFIELIASLSFGQIQDELTQQIASTSKVDIEQFIKWGEHARLLEALHRLFSALFKQDSYAKEILTGPVKLVKG